MTPTQRLERARTCFQRFCKARDDDSPIQWSENVYIASGFYVGRRLTTESRSGIWFAEEDELKIHDADGNLLASFTGDQMFDSDTMPHQRAA